MRFTTESDNKQIEFTINIDGDGDLVLRANGHPVLIIESETGQLCRWSKVPRELGFSLDDNGCLEIGEDYE